MCLALAVLATGVAFFQNRQNSSGIPEDVATASAVIAQITPEEAGTNRTDAELSSEVVTEPEKSEPSGESVPITAAVTPKTDQLSATEPPSDAEKNDITQTPVPAVTEKAQTENNSGSTGAEKKQKKYAEKKLKKNKDTDADENKDQNTQQAAETAASAENEHPTYVIRPGDTLYQISIRCYGNAEAMEEICKLNGISANEIIYPGQVIVLP